MKVEFKYLKNECALKIEWLDKEKTIKIKEDQDLELNELYDDIIDKIEEVEFFEPNDSDETICFEASKKIFEAIERESLKIKEDRKKLML